MRHMLLPNKYFMRDQAFPFDDVNLYEYITILANDVGLKKVKISTFFIT